MMPESFGFKMAFNIICEKAAINFDSCAEHMLTVYPVDGEVVHPDISEGDGYKGEIEYFARLLAGTNTETMITPEQTRESVRMALETMK